MNYVNVELDAYEIAEKVFSENSDLNKNFSFESIDSKTFFEMMLIILIEGLKKFFGDNNNQVNIEQLKKEDIDKINSYLMKLNMKVIFKKYDILEFSLLHHEKKLINFTEVKINENTQVNNLNYIVKRPTFQFIHVISFDFVR